MRTRWKSTVQRLEISSKATAVAYAIAYRAMHGGGKRSFRRFDISRSCRRWQMVAQQTAAQQTAGQKRPFERSERSVEHCGACGMPGHRKTYLLCPKRHEAACSAAASAATTSAAATTSTPAAAMTTVNTSARAATSTLAAAASNTAAVTTASCVESSYTFSCIAYFLYFF